MYYLRSTAAADAIKFTLDKSAVQETAEVDVALALTAKAEVPESAVTQAANDAQQTLRYQQPADDYDQKRSDMACSLDNPDACEACGS
jgi:ribonucleoside-diphosphate reductase alpha chain